ncbi:MAG: lyase family protein [Variovorax sp.]
MFGDEHRLEAVGTVARYFDAQRPIASQHSLGAATRSNEAKALGIAMGAPWFQIRQTLPDAGVVALSANFTLRRHKQPDDGDRRGLGPGQEIYSIDESFIDLSTMRGDLVARSHRVRERILQWTGIPTGIGDYADALDAVRKRLIDVAGKHVDTYVPAYTNGVQAMPISYAHYLLAFADSFERDATRIREAYARLNLSPMGTAVLSNSSWSVNRERLAALLGFDGVIVNSLDAGQISTYDVPLEATAIASSTVIRVGAFLQDVHVQYHQTRPWMLLGASNTYTSSAMPQKANPGVIQNTRAKATDVVASAQAVTLRAHNVTPGMIDYKNTASAAGAKTFVLGVEMLQQLNGVLGALQIDPARALEELESDWITSMELAETLQRAHGVPFRVGHHFASEIVVYARSQNLRPKDFPYAQAQRIYAEAGQKYQMAQAVLPLDEATFRATLSPVTMVRTRTGTGGPQPAEVRRMLAASSAALVRDQAWVNARRSRLIEAEASLNRTFLELARKP